MEKPKEQSPPRETLRDRLERVMREMAEIEQRRDPTLVSIRRIGAKKP